MIREHLYRAKRVNWRKLPKEEWWVEGDLIHEPYGMVIQFCEDEMKEKGECDKIKKKKRIKVVVDSETVCEYTGLPDKIGRKIFEGDIVKINDDVKKAFLISDGAVVYRGGSFIIGDSVGNGTLNSLYVVADINFVLRGEIIGNIFDNPELLKGDGAE